MVKTKGAKLVDKLLTDLRVSEAGRPNLYASRAHGYVLKHIGGRLDASQANNRDFHRFPRLPGEAEGDRLNRRTAQATRLVSQTGLLRPKIESHGGVGVGNRERVGPFCLNGSGH